MKIFGREPALWLALVAIVVKTVSAFVIEVSADQQTLVNAVAAAVLGLVLAVVSKAGAVGAAVLGFAQAVLALAVGYGLDLSAEKQAVLMALVATLVGMFERTQVTPPVPPGVIRAERSPLDKTGA